jgi:hypothetical protein
MTKLAWSLTLMMTLSCGAAWAQDIDFAHPEPVAPAAAAPATPKEHTLTPEMYRYLSDLQRYGGPQDLTRIRAQREADARKERLNSMRWYGMSNSRPPASASPFTGVYGPRWVGNVRGNVYHWRDQGHRQTVISSEGGVPVLR